jgi:hypothetical protein
MESEKNDFVEQKNAEFEQSLDQEVERMERLKVEAHAAATQEIY